MCVCVAGWVEAWAVSVSVCVCGGGVQMCVCVCVGYEVLVHSM